MRHANPIAAVLMTALAVAACGTADDDETLETGDSAMEEQTPVDGTTGPAFSTEVRTGFSAPGTDGSAVRGTLRLLVPVEEADEEDLRLRVELAGLTPGAHAWHIHEGACGIEDTPVEIHLSAGEGQEGLTGPLEAGEDGTVTREITVPPLNARWVRAGAFSVRVHERAGADHGATVACANL